MSERGDAEARSGRERRVKVVAGSDPVTDAAPGLRRGSYLVHFEDGVAGVSCESDFRPEPGDKVVVEEAKVPRISAGADGRARQETGTILLLRRATMADVISDRGAEAGVSMRDRWKGRKWRKLARILGG